MGSEILLNAIVCMALNVYHEGRNQTELGQVAIAQVTMERAQQQYKNVCTVVFEPAQFSWTNPLLATPTPAARKLVSARLMPKFSNPIEVDAWNKALAISRDVIKQKRATVVRANHYCRYDAKCQFLTGMQFKGQIGDHVFYWDSSYKSRALLALN